MSTALQAGPDEVVVPPGEDELPYSFGPPMESELHRRNMNSLVESLRAWLADRPDVYVGGDMALYFSEAQVKKNDFVGPDVFVVTQSSRRLRKSWVVWQEARTPDIVIELTSPSTEAKDRGEKMRVYASALRVPDYFLYDPATGRLEAWRLVGNTYEPTIPAAAGHFPSSVLPIGLRVGRAQVEDGTVPWLRWTDANGDLIPLPEERTSAAEERAGAAEERARQERERADAERARAERLAAKLRAMGLDPDAE